MADNDTRKFFEMLQARWDAGARVCIGLDSDPSKIAEHLRPSNSVDVFNRGIIRETADIALAYKPNIAFYSGVGTKLEFLLSTTAAIHEIAPNVPIVLDFKRGDIGNSNNGYVSEGFETYGADAVTVSPFLSGESLGPFLSRKDRGIIVLCRTSNPGAGEFQDRMMVVPDEDTKAWGLLPGTLMPLYQYVAYRFSRRWNKNGNVALVVGATYPEQLAEVRKIVGDEMWLLLPGIGTQGGDLEAAVRNGVNKKKSGIIINSSSGIIFASTGKDFAQAARQKTLELTSQINTVLATI